MSVSAGMVLAAVEVLGIWKKIDTVEVGKSDVGIVEQLPWYVK